MSPALKCCADSQQGSGVSSSALKKKKIKKSLLNQIIKYFQRLCCSCVCVSYTPPFLGAAAVQLFPGVCHRQGWAFPGFQPACGTTACPELLQQEGAGSLQWGDKHQPGCANSGVTSAAEWAKSKHTELEARAEELKALEPSSHCTTEALAVFLQGSRSAIEY